MLEDSNSSVRVESIKRIFNITQSKKRALRLSVNLPGLTGYPRLYDERITIPTKFGSIRQYIPEERVTYHITLALKLLKEVFSYEVTACSEINRVMRDLKGLSVGYITALTQAFYRSSSGQNYQMKLRASEMGKIIFQAYKKFSEKNHKLTNEVIKTLEDAEKKMNSQREFYRRLSITDIVPITLKAMNKKKALGYLAKKVYEIDVDTVTPILTGGAEPALELCMKVPNIFEKEFYPVYFSRKTKKQENPDFSKDEHYFSRLRSILVIDDWISEFITMEKTCSEIDKFGHPMIYMATLKINQKVLGRATNHLIYGTISTVV
jgi:hypoxanthine-guanine phosphoribosyltransferase